MTATASQVLLFAAAYVTDMQQCSNSLLCTIRSHLAQVTVLKFSPLYPYPTHTGKERREGRPVWGFKGKRPSRSSMTNQYGWCDAVYKGALDTVAPSRDQVNLPTALPRDPSGVYSLRK